MSDLRELYQEVILDHNKRPRNFRVIDGASRMAEGYNPLCGDRLSVYVTIEGDVVRDVAFQGSGCAISKASASLMTDSVKGKSLIEIEQMFHRFHDMVTSVPDSVPDTGALGKLSVFAGVREHPVRVKCASLAWHTLRQAVEGRADTVSTE